MPLRLQSRRQFFSDCGLSLGGIALAAMMERDGLAAAGLDSAAAQSAGGRAPPHFAPRAKAVIQLFMAGGPSQLELFDNKPKLQELHGQAAPAIVHRRQAVRVHQARRHAARQQAHVCAARRVGVGDLGAAAAHGVDRGSDLDHPDDEDRRLQPWSGQADAADRLAAIRPARAWAAGCSTALGSESQNLPGFVVLNSGPRGPRVRRGPVGQRISVERLPGSAAAFVGRSDLESGHARWGQLDANSAARSTRLAA